MLRKEADTGGPSRTLVTLEEMSSMYVSGNNDKKFKEVR